MLAISFVFSDDLYFDGPLMRRPVPASSRRAPHATRLALLGAALLVCTALAPSSTHAQGAQFEEAFVDVGNLGFRITNAGYYGRPNVRNNPAGPPSMEYPLDSGIEHLFDAGFWIGAVRSDGTITVRTGGVTSSAGYAPGASGYEIAALDPIRERSSLPSSDVFTRRATSHQDFETAFADTFRVLPGTSTPMPDPEGRLGAVVEFKSYAWNFPFTEYFTILEFNIVNASASAWDSVYVGLYHDLVVRNVQTTTEGGGEFFNKNGLGFIDSLMTNYAFNAGGNEETLNTYGAFSILGAEWTDPSGQKRFFAPGTRDVYDQASIPGPRANPRYWFFSGGQAELTRPDGDEERYRRMATPYPNPANYASSAEYRAARDTWRERLRTGGLTSQGNYLGLTPIGPFASVQPGDTLTVTFAAVTALKPDEFQGQGGKSTDTEQSRANLVNNVEWARRTYAGEDNDYDGILDPGEDVNGNGVLDRFLIPEPPPSPDLLVRSELAGDKVQTVLYWNDLAETTIDPVSGEADFEGYRIYRSNPGDDRTGDIIGRASLIAQYDKPGNRTGFNNGLEPIRLASPVTIGGVEYSYRFVAEDLLSGWQYAFAVTAFDVGDITAGLPSFESSKTANAVRVFPGTPADAEGAREVGVYPNPYRLNAAWDGDTNSTRRLNFYNLPPRAEIRVYTLAGEIVATLHHDAETYQGDIDWYDRFSADDRVLPGGEHSWDLLGESGLSLSSGLYLYSVRDLDGGATQQGRFVILR